MDNYDLIKEYILPIFINETSDEIYCEKILKPFIHSIKENEEAIYISKLLTSLLDTYSRKYSEAPKNIKNWSRDNKTYNQKQKEIFYEFIEEGEIYKASLIFYTQKISLPKTKFEILKEFDNVVCSKINFKITKTQFNQLRSLFHQHIKDNLIRRYKALPMQKIELDIEHNKVKQIFNEINQLITPIQSDKNIKPSSTKDLWNNNKLNQILT